VLIRGLLAVFVMLVAAPAAEARADATVRFVHAVPGAAAAELSVQGASPVGGSIGFGQVTSYVGVSPGSHEVALKSGAKTLATGKVHFTNGDRYSVVAMASGKKVQLRPYTNGAPAPGKAKIRLIHVAPELGSPDVRLGSQAIAEKVNYAEATPYLTVTPGTYTLNVTKPGDGGSSIVKKSGVVLSAGTTSSAFLLGSRGEPTRVVVSTDSGSTPAGAPKTGLAPLDGGGRPWAVILVIALLAGLLGGAFELRRARAR
jgi:hypothetical protein